jgi:hypothetical protein
MTREEWCQDANRWKITILLAIVLQIIAFSFWAGRISSAVDTLQITVHDLGAELHAHVAAQR